MDKQGASEGRRHTQGQIEMGGLGRKTWPRSEVLHRAAGAGYQVKTNSKLTTLQRETRNSTTMREKSWETHQTQA